MRIRRFDDRDADAVSGLIVRTLLTSCAADYAPEPLEAFARTQTPACMKRRGRETHFYVVEEAGTVVGCGAVGSDERDAAVCAVYSLYVLPECQGRGVGRMIVETLLADEYARRAKVILLHASRTALGFYGRMGFVFRDGCDAPDADGLYEMEIRR